MFADVTSTANLPSVDYIPLFTSVLDYDNDGYSDIYYSGWGGAMLYKNAQDRSFFEANIEASLDGVGLPNGHIFVDIDNDGDQDLFVDNFFVAGAFGTDLFLNNGDGTFTDITDQAGDMLSIIMVAIAMDYNNDGFLDIYNGMGFLQNNGDNTFAWVPNSVVGLPTVGVPDITKQLVSFDYDNDNDQDLFIPLVPLPKLYRNNGDCTFSDVTDTAFVFPSNASYIKGAAAGDFNNDGAIDIFIASFYDVDEGIVFSVLYKNNKDGTFTDITDGAGDINLGGDGFWWGTDFFDYDNDGDLDIYITNEGMGPIDTNILVRNNGDETFSDVTNIAFPQETNPNCATACIGDYNNDGALDIYAPGSIYGGSMGGFFENLMAEDNNWIKIKLEGTESNRDALGAKVYITTGSLTQLREVHTSPVEIRPMHFGLGPEALIDEIKIRWPSGVVQRLNNISANQVITITENAQILQNIEAAVREHSSSLWLLKCFNRLDEWEPNLDLNDDTRIDATDQILVRNIHFLQDQFTMAYTKLMAAVSERMGLTPADEDFISAFDTDLDGDIDSGDYDRIHSILMGTRAS